MYVQANNKPFCKSSHLELKKLPPFLTPYELTTTRNKAYSTSKFSQELRNQILHKPTPWAKEQSTSINYRQESYSFTIPHLRLRSNPPPYFGGKQASKYLSSTQSQDAMHTLPTLWKFTNKLNTLSQISQDQWYICQDLIQTVFNIKVKKHGVCKLCWLQHTFQGF